MSFTSIVHRILERTEWALYLMKIRFSIYSPDVSKTSEKLNIWRIDLKIDFATFDQVLYFKTVMTVIQSKITLMWKQVCPSINDKLNILEERQQQHLLWSTMQLFHICCCSIINFNDRCVFQRSDHEVKLQKVQFSFTIDDRKEIYSYGNSSYHCS